MAAREVWTRKRAGSLPVLKCWCQENRAGLSLRVRLRPRRIPTADLLPQSFEHLDLDAILRPTRRALHPDHVFQMSELYRDAVDIERDGA